MRSRLEQRQIGPREAGTADAVARRGAGLGGVRDRATHEARGVEPLLDRVWRVLIRIAGLVRPVGEIADARDRIHDREREPGLRLHDPVELPPPIKCGRRAQAMGVGSPPRSDDEPVTQSKTAHPFRGSGSRIDASSPR